VSTPTVDLTYMVVQFANVCNKSGVGIAIQILETFGAKTVSELPKSKWPQALEWCEVFGK